LRQGCRNQKYAKEHAYLHSLSKKQDHFLRPAVLFTPAHATFGFK